MVSIHPGDPPVLLYFIELDCPPCPPWEKLDEEEWITGLGGVSSQIPSDRVAGPRTRGIFSPQWISPSLLRIFPDLEGFRNGKYSVMPLVTLRVNLIFGNRQSQGQRCASFCFKFSSPAPPRALWVDLADLSVPSRHTSSTRQPQEPITHHAS